MRTRREFQTQCWKRCPPCRWTSLPALSLEFPPGSHPSETPPDENQEGIPNSVLEAMSTGMVVAATRHGGIPEAIEHGRTGWLVPEEDHTALARAMQQLTNAPRILT